jgi:cell division protein DivIC
LKNYWAKMQSIRKERLNLENKKQSPRKGGLFHMNRIPSILKNKYLITATAFFVWMMFFDHNDFIAQLNRYQKLRQLKESSEYYHEKITAATEELNKRASDPAAYERLAREKYYMKRTNEDVFIFEE